MSRLRALSCFVLLALATAACGGSTTLETQAGPPPFDAVLINLFGTADTEHYLLIAEHDAAELVAQCMVDAGFEFEIPPPPVSAAIPDSNNLADATEMGFGIIGGFRQQVADLTSETTLTAEQLNVAYLSTLSSSEIDRFFLTLDGEEPEPGQLREGGCNGAASDQAYADWLRFFEALPNYTALGEERDTHPDWITARATWKQCMSDRGLDYSEPEAIEADVLARMRATVDEIYPERQVPVVESPDGGVMLDPVVDELLDELLEFERVAAIANVECTEPISADFDSVERLVQQAFVDRNQATIDALLAANS